MRSKLFRLFALFVVLAMVLSPISAKPTLAVTGPTTDEPTTNSPAAPVTTKGVIGGTSDTGLYIVQLVAPSLAAYKGGLPSLSATSPEVTSARKLNVKSPESQAYLSYLGTQQSAFITQMEASLGRSVQVTFQYRNVLNALAVQVSFDEAVALSRMDGVRAVFADKFYQLDTDVGPAWIGAPAIWNGDTGTGVPTQGEGVIIGMIDSGINHLHPSFADVGGDGYDHTNPYGSGIYVGDCVGDPTFCNDKLIGAYDLYPGGSGGPEDTIGHGSHTASTAGGNRHDAIFVVGTTTFTRTISGVAPHANIIAYKVCLNATSCSGTASVSAVDHAITDGADVLNYSISGGDDPWNDAVDLAFLDATAAGIYVSTSAGNTGPGAGTVAHTGPWNASVGASTHTRIFANTFDVTAPGPVPPGLVGLAAVQGTGPALVVDLTAGITYDPANLNGCAAFPAGFFTGKLALIQRGGCTFPVKVTNAQTAGAVGVVTFNSVAGPPITMGGLETTLIPSAMLGIGDGLAVQAWIDANPATAAGRLNVVVNLVENPDFADILAGFSARGPSQADVLKPDFIAPGVNILAAYAASGVDPVQYAFVQGTSMSSPHGAGSAALMVALQPTWSPEEIKSALASSAYNGTNILKDNGVTPADPHDKGSGRLALGDASTVGLVWDETSTNFAAANPALGGDPKTLNLSTLTNKSCVSNCSWTRTVKSVLGFSASYTATFTSTMGIVGTVTPITFTIPAGGTQVLTITADVSALPIGSWAFGNVMFETDADFGLPLAGVNTLYTFTSSPAMAIPDDTYNGTQGSMACNAIDASSIPVGELVSNVTLDTALTHTWVGDLVAKLFSPDGSVLGVFSRAGAVEPADDGTGPVGDSTNLASTSPLSFADSFADNAETMGNTLTTSQVICQDDGRCTYYANPGAVVGLPNFTGFSGENASGTWTFCVGDGAAGDTGTFASWTLTVGTPSVVLPVADQHMTLSVRPAASNVPDLVSIVTDKKSGSQVVSGLQVADEITDLTIVVDGLDQATLYKPLVPPDPTNGNPFNGDGTFFTTVDVVTGTLRLVAQVMESTSLDVDMFVGTGSTPSSGTVVCTSATGAVLEYCNLDAPAPGTYWVLVQNWQGSGAPTDLIALAVGTVQPGDAGNLTVTGPATVLPGVLFDLSVNWANPDLVDEDVFYGVFSVGTDPANPGNLGNVAVNFSYTQPIFLSKQGPATAMTGDVIQYSIVMDGAGPIDGTGWLTDTLPVGVEFAGGLTATFGTATYDVGANSVYWTNYVAPPAAGEPAGRAGVPSRAVALVLGSASAEGQVDATAAPDAPVALVLDDGTVEQAIGLNSPTAAFQFMWFNRFSPAAADFPFTLNQIDIFLTAGSNAVVGDAIDLVVYEDLDGVPANGATLLKTIPVTVQVVPGLNSYDISADPVVFSGPGDVFIGVIDRWVVSGTTPPNFPAAEDTTASQVRSWVASWVADPPDPALLPSDDLYSIVDNLGPTLAGNWIIRGYGETVSSMPEVITITFDVSVTAESGNVTNVADLTYNGDPFRADSVLEILVPPDVMFTSNSPVMLGDVAVFTSTVTGTGPFEYLWTFGDGITGTLASPTHTYGAIGSYTVTVMVTSDVGADTYSALFEVVGIPPDVMFTSNSPVMLGDVAVFTSTVTGTGPFEYLWDFDDGITSTLASPTHTYATAGTFTVTLMVTSEWGADTYTAEFIVNGIPMTSTYFPLIWKEP